MVWLPSGHWNMKKKKEHSSLFLIIFSLKTSIHTVHLMSLKDLGLRVQKVTPLTNSVFTQNFILYTELLRRQKSMKVKLKL
jgi:hypothetical protein